MNIIKQTIRSLVLKINNLALKTKHKDLKFNVCHTIHETIERF